MWGDLYIGVRKALVEIRDVISRAAKVPYMKSGWDAARLTLGDVMDMPDYNRQLAVNASQIHARIRKATTVHTTHPNALPDIPPTNHPTNLPVDYPADPITDPPNNLPIDPLADPPADPPADPTTGPPNNPSINLLIHLPTDPAADPLADPKPDPAADQGSVPSGTDKDNAIRNRQKSDIWHGHYNLPLY